MIGKAYWAIFQYYDGKLNKMAFKKRPVLVIGKADDKDWVVLPGCIKLSQNVIKTNFVCSRPQTNRFE